MINIISLDVLSKFWLFLHNKQYCRNLLNIVIWDFHKTVFMNEGISSFPLSTLSYRRRFTRAHVYIRKRNISSGLLAKIHFPCNLRLNDEKFLDASNLVNIKQHWFTFVRFMRGKEHLRFCRFSAEKRNDKMESSFSDLKWLN